MTRRKRGKREGFLQKETKETKVGTKGDFGFGGRGVWLGTGMGLASLILGFVSLLCFCRNSGMHPRFDKADKLSKEVIGAAIEVHRDKGPGLIESIYERCLLRELQLRGISCQNQKVVLVEYKGMTFEEPLRFDVLVEDCLLVELKVVQSILPVHKAQLLSYMKLLGMPVGLLLNFYEMKLTDGISRLILPGANRPKLIGEE